MRPLETLGRLTTPDGAELVLYHRDGEYQIRIDGLELMSSRAHGSEEGLARLTLEAMPASDRPHVLVGGLGLGFTLRATLDRLPAKARVDVAEYFVPVVEWNRSLLGELAGHPLADPRVTVHATDVSSLFEPREPYDAILLDVDNGPSALTLYSNAHLYSERGLSRIRKALARRGMLGVWSSGQEPRFLRRLRRAGFDGTSHRVAARGNRGPRHTIFVARRVV